MGLSGNINVDALLEIPTLRTITLVNNSFSGPIPDFSRIGALKALYLSFNDFSGEIPTDFFSKTLSLKKLWLSGNKFSGKMPDSLGQIPHLIELQLENNEFSGAIPELGQKSLTSIDLSNNKLEGEIPESMSRFNARAFEGNPGLCGNPIGKECLQSVANASQEQTKPADKSVTGWVVIGVFVTLLAITVVMRSRQGKEEKFNKLGKENLDEVVEVRVHSSNRRSVDLNHSQKGGSTRRGSSQKGIGDLVMVNEEIGVFGMADLMKAAAEVLGSGGLGSAYKAVMANGVAVVVKRVREMNKMSKDSFDSEMRRLGRLSHQNVLTPLAYHYRKDEKLLVSQHVSKGSLLYVLHGMKLKLLFPWFTPRSNIKRSVFFMNLLQTLYTNTIHASWVPHTRHPSSVCGTHSLYKYLWC